MKKPGRGERPGFDIGAVIILLPGFAGENHVAEGGEAFCGADFATWAVRASS